MRYISTFVACLFYCSLVFAQSDAEPNDQQGEVRYISDNLYTFLHAGPGRNYRILGSVQAGSRVLQLQIDENGQFIEIIDDKQRTGWVDANFITAEQSIRDLIPELQEKIREREQRLQQQAAGNQQQDQQLASLTTQNNQLQQQLSELQKANKDLAAQLNKQDQSEQMDWFIRGGIIALAGLILGVLLTFLPKRRRRDDNWM